MVCILVHYPTGIVYSFQARAGHGLLDIGTSPEQTRQSSPSECEHPMQLATDTHLSDHGAGSGALVLPGGREDTDGLVVAGQTVDPGLDQNKAELAVLVLAVALKVLAHGDGLLH